LAFGAFGLVKRPVLLNAGVSPEAIRTRLRTGALLLEYPGVYRVGHRAPSMESSYLAAVWACGEGALLSGQAAAYLLGLTKGKQPKPEVIAPHRRRIEGVETRRYRQLHRTEATRHRGIPITTVARTLVDLAPVLGLDELARACHEAGVRYRTTPAHVQAVLARHRTMPGAATLRAVLLGDAPTLLSQLEAAFIALLTSEHLPIPQTNRPKGSYYVDCRWPQHNLTVELDSYRYHNSRQSWERDRQREREARARGDDFRRYTWDDVFAQPRPMLQDLSRLLA
jgi:predicted transcriptional regulator of viral defense system